MNITIKAEQKPDGRWKASAPELAEYYIYDDTENGAKRNMFAMALEVLAMQIRDGGDIPDTICRLEAEPWNVTTLEDIDPPV